MSIIYLDFEKQIKYNLQCPLFWRAMELRSLKTEQNRWSRKKTTKPNRKTI